MAMPESPAERGKRVIEKGEAKEREIAKKFDPKEIIRKASELRTVFDSQLGEIKYTVLTTGDLFDLNKIENKDARARAMLFKLLHKAYPELKEEDIDRFPMDVATRLLNLLTNQTDFLQPEKTSTVGSESTPKHNVLAS
jgi:hypothetical protein